MAKISAVLFAEQKWWFGAAYWVAFLLVLARLTTADRAATWLVERAITIGARTVIE